ncbi:MULTISPECIES: transcription elongation factor GreA [unclassified Pseudoclavibacter]|uniref:transcription elongation factor GreA n=1 Tax=unclassified Pseudoclavibacter TaxID=2615177 RepID=UPI0013013CF4|nr:MULTISPECIES: transcription elongation factor GreA [unclassified Pseudoclavibacter]KAB1647402.1 transcription elongation factor GreA [Pseudoclavibacter sp. CFCC 14310]KAB1657134.1 transcription elongation factor GreA [Pseudoclavibacter sp. CFCC 11306]KAB1659948.1 transcription elongation factor GreA [Pseudoclavibacter sp. CFCC 13796]KAB1663089.1 transcription elongation factor GreA [Pseudoclavibacter sp. CFCC 13611]
MADQQEGTWLTQEAYDRLHEELDHLRGPWRRDIAKRIEEAREEGDLRENGGYHAAKDEQGKFEGRIRELEALLHNAQVGTVEVEDGRAARGTVVTANVAGRELRFLLGNREIASGDIKVFSEASPLGGAVVNHKAGETVSYEAPNGKTMQVEIVSVETYSGE